MPSGDGSELHKIFRRGADIGDRKNIMNKNKKIRIIRKEDREYPASLLNISDAPETLYCMGRTEILSSRMLAVVGSRKCSQYGRTTAMRIGEAAALNEITVVSGMAKGIDSFAHMGALKGGGRTIAVLGCGVDICYPRENRALYEQIASEGLLVSELPPGTEPRPYTFPLRNRIISGLAEAVTVVEAGTGSGALITAERAAEQGREVFAVPGNINSQYSLGTNKLLTDGATPIAVVDDIFRGMGINPAMTEEEASDLGKDEKEVYDIIKATGEVTVDYLCRTLNRTPVFINGIITVLEIKGLISYNLGKIFIAKF